MASQPRGVSILAISLLAYGALVLASHVASLLLSLDLVPAWVETLGLLIGTSSVVSGWLLRRRDPRARWPVLLFGSLMAVWFYLSLSLLPDGFPLVGLPAILLAVALGYWGFRYISRQGWPAA